MRKFENTLISALSGTAMMTAFSYAISMVENENFSEPEHLGTLLHRSLPQTSKKDSNIAGWIAHYGVGILFMHTYQLLWKKRVIKRNIKSALVFGLVSGIIGAVVWEKTLKNHPSPPHINLTKYLMQLIPAHIVFAVCGSVTSKLIDTNENLSIGKNGV